MKIIKISAKKIDLDLLQPLNIAIGSISKGETVLCQVETDEGIVGYGEGSSVPFITGENPKIIMHAISLLENELVGEDPFAIAHIHRIMDRVLRGHGSAKCAIDLALYDIMGKKTGVPLYKLLGGNENEVETDMTIGIDEPSKMAEKASKLAVQGFRQIKVKAGKNPDEDVHAIKLIREACGEGVRLKVDANQGWNSGEAAIVIPRLATYGVEAVEQPVPYWDIEGMAYLRAKSPIKIMADESCFTPYDASLLIKSDAVDVINIKLMKCGGLYPGMMINQIAKAAGIPCMLGCMMESRLSIAAGAALVASDPNFEYGDLDSFIDFAEIEAVSGGFTFDCPIIKLTDAPGHGVVVNF